MLQVNNNRVAVMAMIFVLAMPCAAGFGQSKEGSKQAGPFDPVEFIKGFRIGMSYDDVQALLPKIAKQDTLAYLPGEEGFLLSVDIPGLATWSAAFKFDTIDLPVRRPEQLVEFGCSAALSTRNESFETIVRRVTTAFGEPVELDRSQDHFQQAGWRVSGGSVLTLEYSTMTGSEAENVNIEFVIRKSSRRNAPDFKAVA